MFTKSPILLFTIVIGLALHAGFVLLLHNLTLKPHLVYENMVNHEEQWEQRQARTQILGEIFDHLSAVETTVSKPRFALRKEHAPSLELYFPAPNSFDLDLLSTDKNSFKLTAIETPQILGQTDKQLLTPPLPIMTGVEIPPQITMQISDEKCECYGTLAESDHFDLSVEYTPRKYRPGYVFKLTFQPKPEVLFKRIQQNYLFLIDRSNSIPRSRYVLNKQAVADALERLNGDDTFNILLFDNKVVRFSGKTVVANGANISKAQAFLNAQGHGGLFAATELYASLGKIIPNDVHPQQVNTAVLLSDGDTYLSQDKQRRTIGGWTKANAGKVSLYTIASGQRNNLPLLELLSSFNKGSLVYVPDHKQLGTRLNDLLQKISAPIGQQMSATVVTSDVQMHVLLQPKTCRLPDLHQNTPFTIYGSTNRLSDFVIFLQGNYYDHHLDIKKAVSFKGAKVGSPSIEPEWTQRLVEEYYEHYFEDGKIAHLEAAKKMLAPLNLPVPLLDKR